MNFTYIFINDPLNEALLGNITWQIPDMTTPAHWVHAELSCKYFELFIDIIFRMHKHRNQYSDHTNSNSNVQCRFEINGTLYIICDSKYFIIHFRRRNLQHVCFGYRLYLLDVIDALC